MRIAFIGGGNMAEAILHGLFFAKTPINVDVVVSEPIQQRRTVLADRFPELTVCTSNLEAVSMADIVILACKPQNLHGIASEIGTSLSKQTIVSILASVSMKTLQEKLLAQSVVRVMPNLPAKLGKGVSFWIHSTSVASEHLRFVKNMLSSIGEHFKVEDESFLDIATALSGSGPGYVFAFMEALYDCAIDLGVDVELARQMLIKTVAGSVALAAQSDLSFGDLKRTVASPGGTTEAALQHFEKGEFNQLVAEAVKAALKRSQTLST